MERLTAAERIIAENTVCVLLVRGENADGRRIFAYLGIRADRLQEFMSAQNQEVFSPEDYGIIIESGEGEPSVEVRERMTRDYGFNHEAMLDISGPGKAGELTKNLGQYATKLTS